MEPYHNDEVQESSSEWQGFGHGLFGGGEAISSSEVTPSMLLVLNLGVEIHHIKQQADSEVQREGQQEPP